VNSPSNIIQEQLPARAVSREEMMRSGRLMPATSTATIAACSAAGQPCSHRSASSSSRVGHAYSPTRCEPPPRLVTLLRPEGPEVAPPGVVVRVPHIPSAGMEEVVEGPPMPSASAEKGSRAGLVENGEAFSAEPTMSSRDAGPASTANGANGHHVESGSDESHRIRLGEFEQHLQARLAKAEGARLALQAQLDSGSAELDILREQVEDVSLVKRQNAELRVELAAAKQLQESLREDATDEAQAAEKLRHQLSMAEVAAQAEGAALAHRSMQEATEIRAREVGLEAELHRAHRIADQIQQDLAGEAATAAHLRSQLAMAEVLSQDPAAAAAIRAALQGGEAELRRRLEAEVRTAEGLRQELQQAVPAAASLGQEDVDSQLTIERLRETEQSLRLEVASEALAAEDLRRRLQDSEAQVIASGTGASTDEHSGARPPPELQQAAEGSASSLRSVARRRPSEASLQTLFTAAAADDDEAIKNALCSEVESRVEEIFLSKNEDGCSLLQVALEAGAFSVAKVLLELRKKMIERQEFQNKLCQEMAEHRSRQFVNTGPRGCGALAVLCRHEDAATDVLVMLMEVQADPYQPDSAGVTPFLECARSGNRSFMKMLLKGTRGAVLLDMDRTGQTALHFAAQAGKSDAVELLLQAKADADVVELSGLTPAGLARKAGHMELTAMLAEAMGDDAVEELLAEDSQAEAHGQPSSVGEVPDVRSAHDEGSEWEVPDDESFTMDIPEEEHLQDRFGRQVGQNVAGVDRQGRFLGPGQRLQSL